jgi:uncharacterized protein
MAIELNPLVPPGRQLIERYGPAGFLIGGETYTGSVIVFPERTIPWDVGSAAALTAQSLKPVVEHGEVDILLLGLGRGMTAVAAALRAELRAVGIALEAMDTGAACRTYNLLLAEERRVAAALILPA